MAATVALPFPHLSAPMYTHEKVTLSAVAKSIARLVGHRFDGVQRSIANNHGLLVYGAQALRKAA
jgi:hypothetical protein